MWKEVVMASLRYYPRIFLEGLRKTTNNLIRIADVLAEIQTEDFLNKDYYANLLSLNKLFWYTLFWGIMQIGDMKHTHILYYMQYNL
jgi:hypothetical protein